MIAAVIRHAKVDIEWEFWQTSKEYDQGCTDYDTAPVLPVEVHLPDADFKTIYVSDLSRTAATHSHIRHTHISHHSHLFPGPLIFFQPAK